MPTELTCLECGHLAAYHDGIGCNDQNGDDECYCTTAINMPGDEPSEGIYA